MQLQLERMGQRLERLEPLLLQLLDGQAGTRSLPLSLQQDLAAGRRTD